MLCFAGGVRWHSPCAKLFPTVGLAIALVATPAGAAKPERVTVPFREVDASGANIKMRAFLFRPSSTLSPVGAVVMLHGCGGPYATRAQRKDEISPGLRSRAEMLVAEGYAVLVPDSFGMRGVGETCTIPSGQRTVTPMRRRLDALEALAWLARQPWIAADRIALVGYSHGGSTTLATVNAGDPAIAQFRAAAGAPPFYRAAVAFYPGCRRPLRAGDRWAPGAPTRIYIGTADDWSPAAPCIELGESAQRRGLPLEVTAYPGAHHAFDAPAGRVRVRTDVPGGVNPGKGVTVGPDPAAREDANSRLKAFLRETIGAGENSIRP